MTENKPPVEIIYFSDVLCIWAYAAEVRLQELHKNFGAKIKVVERFSPVFADTNVKVGQGWKDRGGYKGFGENVQKTAHELGYIKVNEKVWRDVRPTTSTQAHMFVKALQNLGETSQATAFAHGLRKAFFIDAKDISNIDDLFKLAGEQGLPVDKIKSQLDTGAAHAALMADHKAHYDQHVKGSPTYIMNHGRQVLFGNVGYRILEANVMELIEQPHDNRASWC